MVDYSVERAAFILDEMLQKIDLVIEKVADILPKKFPRNISDPIFENMRSMKTKLTK